MQHSIADYQEIYCSPAAETIEYEMLLWSGSVESFRTDALPAVRERYDDQVASRSWEKLKSYFPISQHR